MTPEIDLTIILCLALVALTAGFLDAIAGGGGLITLPALLIAGIDPVAAIATNKLQAASATISATVAFARRRMIEWRTGLPMALLSLMGGAAGALSISLLPNSALQAVVPVLLILVALYFALAPKLTDEARAPRLSMMAFTLGVVPFIGFYDGIFGPGVGSFFMIAFVLLMGQGILRAMSNSKLMNAACNIGSLIVFSMMGTIVWPIALAMAAGAFIGAQLGARCAVRFGSRLIKPLMITMCCVMAVKLLSSSGNPLGEWVLGQAATLVNGDA
jgi:uncharacterized membrane protein YfcA